MTEAGLYSGVSHDRYHADDFGETPTLSRSVAHLLVSRSPLHAWAAHPKLGNCREDESSPAMHNGSLLHTLLLGGGADIEVIDARDYRKDAAKDQRDEALERGALPVLRAIYDKAMESADRIAERLYSDAGVDVAAHEHEMVALWEEPTAGAPVRCRGRLDMLLLKDGIVRDLKIVRSAVAGSFLRTMIYDGLDIQAASYVRAIEAIHPELAGRVEFEFLLVEAATPHAVRKVSAAGSMRALGEGKWNRAVRLWRRCLDANEWPGYLPAVVEAPAWALADDFESELSSTTEPAWVSEESR